ncbi:MAG: hypothetical protein GY820_39110 [Gammaproteobacteria bacterium]|nr:hypothetical protein [Gammaproteobacteria bacterium]
MSWIKIHRKLIEWEWFQDSKTVHLFLYLLMKANCKDGLWRGNKIKRGQLITGRKSISKNTGISEQSIRTILKRLEKSQELTIKPTNKFSLITILNYNEYQESKKAINQQSNQQLTSNQPATNHKQEVKKLRKKIYGEFKNVRLTPEQHKKLIDKFNSRLEEKIYNLSEYMKMTGKSYKDHYLTILAWDRREEKSKPQPQKIGGHSFD